MFLNHMSEKVCEELARRGVDTKWLRDLVSRYRVPAVALHAPVAPYTADVRVRLPSTAESTPRVSMEFPAGVQIVGFYASVIEGTYNGFAGSPLPTLDQIDVAMDVDRSVQVTTNDSKTAVAGVGGSSSFVQLSSLSTMVPRLHFMRVKSNRPDLGFVFRSTYGSAGSSGFPADIIIKVSAFYIPCEE